MIDLQLSLLVAYMYACFILFYFIFSRISIHLEVSVIIWLIAAYTIERSSNTWRVPSYLSFGRCSNVSKYHSHKQASGTCLWWYCANYMEKNVPLQSSSFMLLKNSCYQLADRVIYLERMVNCFMMILYSMQLIIKNSFT